MGCSYHEKYKPTLLLLSHIEKSSINIFSDEIYRNCFSPCFLPKKLLGKKTVFAQLEERMTKLIKKVFSDWFSFEKIA